MPVRTGSTRQSLRRNYGARSKRVRYPVGPFSSMQDSLDPTTSQPNVARKLTNMYPIAPHDASRIVGRPGFAQLGAQLGSSGRRTPQLFYQFTKLDGTEYTVAIVGGHFYTLNWSTSTWTEVVSGANFSSASITLSQTARCYAVTFADTMVVSDGVNLPWTWDGTSGASGLTSLTNAPVFFGKLTVHYGKLFGIKNAERSTFVWSEENTPNTGYEAGGYNNAWTLGQTDTNALFALQGANEGLYVLRARSSTIIYGEVTTNFSSTGTREAVSPTLGTTAPASVFHDGRFLMFMSADGEPCAIPPGSEPISFFEAFRETVDGLDPAAFDDVEGLLDPVLGTARFCCKEAGTEGRRTQLVLHQSEGSGHPHPIAVFTGIPIYRVGVVENGDGEPRMLHGDDSGYVYEHGTPNGATWDDAFNGDTVAISHSAKLPFVGTDSLDIEKHFDRIDLELYVRTGITAFSLNVLTHASYATPTVIGPIEAGSDAAFALWDVAQWDDALWSAVSLNAHVAVGLDSFGPYLDVEITHAVAGEQFGLQSAVVTARPASQYPGMP